MHRPMRFTKICGPVNNGEEKETDWEQYKSELVESAILGATKHNAPLDHSGKSY